MTRLIDELYDDDNYQECSRCGEMHVCCPYCGQCLKYCHDADECSSWMDNSDAWPEVEEIREDEET